MARLRSPGYPSVSLQGALEYVEQIYTLNRTNTIDREAAAKSMGYSGSSGASDKTIANLAHYGLAEKAGKGEIRVTQLAVDILRPESDATKSVAIREAAGNPQLFALLTEKFPDGHFSPDALKNSLSRMGFQEAAIPSASRAYAETCQFLEQVGAYDSYDKPQSDGAESVPLNGKRPFGGASIGDLVQWESDGALQFNSPVRVRDVSEDGQWAFVDGSETGVPMDELVVEQQAPKQSITPPTLPLGKQTGEKEWVRAPLGKGAYARILVSDDLSDAQIERLRIVLDAMKEGDDTD